MPENYPFDEIPDGFGGIWKIITWECHLCKNNNWVSDTNTRWKFRVPEICRTLDCRHMRCLNCYDCDGDDIRLQHCDGGMIMALRNEGEAVTFSDSTRTAGDSRPTFPCPLKAAYGCNKIFLNSEHAAHHAATHNPVVPWTCPFPGCGRPFAREGDRNFHFVSHSRPTPVRCPLPDCNLQFDTEANKAAHLMGHFGYKGT